MQAFQPRQTYLPLLLLWIVSTCTAGALALPISLYAQEETDSIPESSTEPFTESFEATVIADTEDQAADPALLEQARADKTRYEQMITNLENTNAQDVYNPELTEAYLALAGTLEVLGENAAAADVYDKALQNVRISNGLNSLQQLPILEHLLDNNLIRNNWDNVDNYSHLIFHIARRNYPVGDPRRVDALDRLGAWKLRAVQENLSGGESRSAQETVSMFKNELALLEESGNFAGKGIQLATLYLGEARAQLVVARQINERPLSYYRTSGSQTVTTQRCRLVRLANGQVTQICETVEVPNIDYYLDPSFRKNQEIGLHLGEIRNALSSAYKALQQDGDANIRNALLAEIHALTNAYNTFVTDNHL